MMISNIRAFIRVCLFFIAAFLTILFVGLIRIFPVKKSIFYKWKNVIAKLFASSSMKIIGMELEIVGKPPDPPFFLVSNHLSYIDILPLWFCCKGTFIAKSEISRWPFFGMGAKIMDVLFINRENNRDIRRVNELIADRITDEQGIILFPEGTSSKGSEVLPFNPSLLFYPALQNIPVSYASIAYETSEVGKPASHYVCWWGDMKFSAHFFELMKLKKIHAKLAFGEKPVKENNRKKLAKILHQKVLMEFHQVSE